MALLPPKDGARVAELRVFSRVNVTMLTVECGLNHGPFER